MTSRAISIGVLVVASLGAFGCGGSAKPAGPSSSPPTTGTCKPGDTPITNNQLLHGKGCQHTTVVTAKPPPAQP